MPAVSGGVNGLGFSFGGFTTAANCRKAARSAASSPTTPTARSKPKVPVHGHFRPDRPVRRRPGRDDPRSSRPPARRALPSSIPTPPPSSPKMTGRNTRRAAAEAALETLSSVLQELVPSSMSSRRRPGSIEMFLRPRRVEAPQDGPRPAPIECLPFNKRAGDPPSSLPARASAISLRVFVDAVQRDEWSRSWGPRSWPIKAW